MPKEFLFLSGCDGLRLWELVKRVELSKPSHARNPQDPITCAAWVTPRDDNKELLCCGTGLGYLLLWKQCEPAMEFEETMARQIGTGCEVMAISCDASEIGTQVLTGT